MAKNSNFSMMFGCKEVPLLEAFLEPRSICVNKDGLVVDNLSVFESGMALKQFFIIPLYD